MVTSNKCNASIYAKTQHRTATKTIAAKIIAIKIIATKTIAIKIKTN